MEASLSNPNAPAAGVQHLRDWFRFFATESHVLRLRPSLFFQQAANSASGTVAEQAKALWDSGTERRPWLRRIGKRPPEPPITLAGHSSSVDVCAFSPDGLRVFSAGTRTVRIWDATTGTELTAIAAPGMLALSPDCRRAVTSKLIEYDVWRLILLDIETGRELATLGSWKHSVGCRPVAFSSDGRRIAWGFGLTVDIWDMETISSLKSLRVVSTTVGEPTTCAFSPDGRRLAVAYADGVVNVWEVESGISIASFKVRPAPTDADLYGGSPPVACEFLSDGRRLAVAGGTSLWTLGIWDIESGTKLASLEGHTRPVKACAVSPDGSRIVSASADHTLRLWDAETGATISRLTGHTDGVESCAFSPDGRLVLSASRDHTLRIWNVAGAFGEEGSHGHDDFVTACAFSPDGGRVVSASYDKTVKLWDAERGDELATSLGHEDLVYDCAFSPDGSQFASASQDKTVRLWEAETGLPRATLAHGERLTACAFAMDGRRLVSASEYHVKLWDAETGTELATMDGGVSYPRCCSFSPDSSTVLGVRHNTIYLWEARTGTGLAEIKSGHFFQITACLFSPDGLTILSSSADGTMRLFDRATGNHLSTLTGHRGGIKSCAFLPDGRRIVSASDDQTLKLWDAQTGAELATFSGHSDSVDLCAFSPDGLNIVSVSRDQSLKVWDTDTGKELCHWHAGVSPTSNVMRVLSWSPNGRRIVLGLASGEVLFLKPQGLNKKQARTY